jgi:6-phosphogluconolactonase/glucosamine-6-phosphate isomerase/deaminase
MKTEVLSDVDSVARKGAALIAAEARAAVADRGRFVMAVSGGHTPWLMLGALAPHPASRREPTCSQIPPAETLR